MRSSFSAYVQGLTPERVFVLLSIVFGTAFFAFVPLMQVPDEVSHLYRAYQISELRLFPEKVEGGYGGYMPANLVRQSATIQGNIPFHPENKYSLATTKHFLVHREETNERLPVIFNGSAQYNPIPYIPQATGIAVGRLVHAPPLVIMYLGRLVNLVAWGVLIYLSIKIAPKAKWAFTILALTPMSLFQANSLSADALTNGLAFLLVAVFMRLFFANKPLSQTWLGIIAAVSLGVGFAKPTFFLLPLIFFLLPTPALASKKTKLIVVTIIIASILLPQLWLYAVRDVSKVAAMSVDTGAQPSAQLKYVLAHPLSYLHVLFNTYLGPLGDGIVDSFVGILGWFDTKMPSWIVAAYYILIFLGFATNPLEQKQSIVWWRRLLLLLLIGACIGAISTALYLYYSPYMYPFIYGMQGRYFIPISVLLIPLTVGIMRIELPEQTKRTFFSASLTVLLFFSFVFTVLRYYV